MYKRITSILLVCLIGFGCFQSPVLADSTEIFLNEVFDDYPLNSMPESIDMTGVDTRTVQINGTNKALYGKVWGSPVEFTFPVGKTQGSVTYSFDLMIKGADIFGKMLNLNATTSLLNINESGSINLEDGYKIGGQREGVWHSYSARIDYDNNTYDLYVDGKQKLKSWVFNSKPTRLESVSFTFMPVDDDAETDIYIDNVRAYSSERLLKDSDFPKKQTNSEVIDFTPATEKMKYDMVYVDSKGTEGLPEVIFAQKANAVTDLAAPPNGASPCLHVLQMGTSDPFVDCMIDVDESLYVFQSDVYIASLSNADGGTLQLVYPTGTGTSTLLLGMNNSNGMLKSGSTSLNVSVPTKKWVRFAVACNRFTSKIDIYMNGKLIQSGLDVPNGIVIPRRFRMGFTSRTTSSKNNEVYFNNIKIYAGNELMDFGDEIGNEVGQTNQSTLISRGEKPAAAKAVIGSGAVFMTNCDYLYYGNEKRTYSSLGIPKAYKDENGVTMVSAELLSRGLNIPISVQSGTVSAMGKAVTVGEVGELDAAPVEKDGTVFVPAVSFTEKILSRHAYEDGRPFVFVSNDAIDLSNNPIASLNREASDTLYRYVQYQRPDRDKVYADVLSNSYKQHPRLFIKEEEIPKLREKLQSTPELKGALHALLANCEEIINSEPTPYAKPDGKRLFEACNDVREKIVKLAIAYYATGDEKYLDAMWTQTRNALSWEDWNIETHYLDSGEIGPGIALAYDTLYDYLTDEEKAYFRNRVCELYFDDVVYRYCNTSLLVTSNLTYSNWGAVCYTSILFTALTFIDEEPENSPLTEKCKFVAAETIQALEYVLECLSPDGSVLDGVGYLKFFSESLSWSFNALRNICGTDYGLADSSCYSMIPDYAMYIQSPNGAYNVNGTERGTIYGYNSEMFLNAKLSNNPAKMALVDNMRKSSGKALDAHALLWYEPIDASADLGDYPLDKFFPGQQIVTMRSSWNDADFTFFAAIGGANMIDRSHFDKGSFALDMGGVSWFMDFGKDNVNVTGGYYNEAGHTLYSKRAEGHNCLVINPSKNDPGQSLDAFAGISHMETKDKGAIAVYDLKDVYRDKVSFYNRGFYLGEDRNTLVVRDELELTQENNEIYWFLHTQNSEIEIGSDGKSAILKKDGKKLRIEVICDAAEWRLEAREATYLFPEMDRGDEYPRDAYSKVALVGKASGKLNISAKFSIIGDGNTYAPLTDTPISEWSIPDGELAKKPQLDGFAINGKPSADYISNKFEYVIDVSADDPVPVIEGYSNSGAVSVKQAKTLKDTAVITFVAPNGQKKEYTIKFNVNLVITDNLMNIRPEVGLPLNAEFATISNFVANHEQVSNPAPGAIDGDLKTRWSSDVIGAYYDADLGSICDLSGIAMVFAIGDEREYKYDILISDDGLHYTNIYSGTSTGATAGWEFLAFNQKARYVRYVGYGHADGAWTNLCEFRPCLLKSSE